MAIRPVFEAIEKTPYFFEHEVSFQFYSGFSETQKRKSIGSLHQSFLEMIPNTSVLEISSNSDNLLGVKLSAFNLFIYEKQIAKYSVESAFQASKIFENGGPYLDLLNKTSREAKKDPRIRESGRLTAFIYKGELFPLWPKTLFYDWLYINALNNSTDLSEQILHYSAFTDIEYNPHKSVNCQARSAAIFVSLQKNNMLCSALKSKESFSEIVYGYNQDSTINEQMSLEI